MDWKDVAQVIAPLAPTLGKVLGGLVPFPGASLAGEAVGRMLASKFGVAATPEAVAGAIKGAPPSEAVAKLEAVTEEAKAKWPAIAEIEKAHAQRDAAVTESTNATMRAEVGREHWFFTGWRPGAGWVLVINAAVFGVMINVAAFMAAFSSKSEPLTILTGAWPLFLAYFGALAALVGVYVVARSSDKKVAIENGTTATSPAPTKPAPPPAPARAKVNPGVPPGRSE